MTETNVSVMRVKLGDYVNVIEVLLRVRVGLRVVDGSALMFPTTVDANQYEPWGDSIDCWLSGGIVVAIDDLEMTERAAFLEEIIATAAERAANAHI